jgi:class 3 adenylate cyclase
VIADYDDIFRDGVNVAALLEALAKPGGICVRSAMWQRITGRIKVLDDVVRVEIDLPWIMQLLRDTVAKQVQGRGVALLEKPPGQA